MTRARVAPACAPAGGPVNTLCCCGELLVQKPLTAPAAGKAGRADGDALQSGAGGRRRTDARFRGLRGPQGAAGASSFCGRAS